MESADDATFAGNEFNDIGIYMTTYASLWFGFQTSGLVDINAADLAIYMDWPGFITGTTNVPSTISQIVPQTGGGTDSFGNTIEAFKFETTEIPGGTTTGNVWYSVFVPPTITNNQIYTSIGINYANSPGSLVNTSTEPTVYVINVNYTGSNWSNGVYKVYTASQGNGFNVGAPGIVDLTNNYFKGGNLT
jgi:hypothetical protein